MTPYAEADEAEQENVVDPGPLNAAVATATISAEPETPTPVTADTPGDETVVVDEGRS